MKTNDIIPAKPRRNGKSPRVNWSELQRQMDNPDLPQDALSRAENEAEIKSLFVNLSTFLLDDIGNGERLAAMFGGEMKYIPELGKWAIWDNAWEISDQLAMNRAKRVARAMQQEAGEAKATAEKKLEKAETNKKKSPQAFKKAEEAKNAATLYSKHANASASVTKLRAMLEAAESEKDMVRPYADFDSNPRLLVCQNVAVELLEDGVRYRPRVQEDYATLSTSVRYEPDAVSVPWEEFLSTFQPDPELCRWLQKLTGYSLLGRNPERLLVLSVSGTSTGKSTFSEVVRLVLGGYASPFSLSAFRGSFTEKHRADIIGMLPKRFVVRNEASDAWTLHAEQIKSMTGGDALTVRGAYEKNYVSMVPAFTPWVFSNQIPTIQGADEAFDRRLTTTVWEHTVSRANEDRGWTERYFNPRENMGVMNLRGVLRWMVDGYVLYVKEGLREPPMKVLQALERIRSGLSNEGTFLDEVCDFGPEYFARNDELFSAYEMWCDRAGIHARERMNAVKLGAWLTGRGYPNKQRRSKDTGKRVWGRAGLRMRREWRLKG